MLKKICNLLTTIILIGLAILAALLVLPTILGYKSLAVLSGSMEPKYQVGSIVYAKEVNPNELQIGDVISYSIGGETLVTHRVFKIMEEEQQLITKGDANDTEDMNPVSYAAVVGKVQFHVPYLGYISIYAKTPLGIIVICGILIIMILLIFLPEIISENRDGKDNPDEKDNTEIKKEEKSIL